MKEIDFLPARFHDALRRKRRTRRNVWFCVALGASFAMLNAVGVTRIRMAEASLDAARASDSERLARRMHLRELQAKRELLNKRAGLISQLDDNAPLDVILGEITRMMSDSMALRKVSLERVKAPETDAKAEGKKEKKQKDAENLLEPRNTEMVLSAVAANDVEVGMFFGRLSGSPLFEQVRLGFSRETDQSGRQMRAFELRFLVKRVAFQTEPVNGNAR